MEINLKTEKVYSIRELNYEVRGLLNREFPEFVWVHGEIQDYNKNKYKPHIYFRLCEKHPEIDEIIAQVSAVIFEDRKPTIAKTLKQPENQFELKDDLEVKLLCKIDFFPKSGKLVLIVEGIDPVYTLGRLAQARQKIVEELKNKGLLDKNKKIPLPLIPLNIGLITSYNSAAYNDFLDELKRAGFGFKIYFFNSFMQGKNVESDVLRALEIFEKMQFLDLVVITRGGGSTADLSWFDNKRMAEKIANFRLPVLTGIGHQINITIADLVAHTYSKTPTAIAQFIIKRIRDFLDNLEEKNRFITEQTKDILLKEKQRVKTITKGIYLETHKFLIIKQGEIEYINKHIGLDRFQKILCEKRKNLFEKGQDLKNSTQRIIRNNLKNLTYLEEKIKLLDPMNTVKRGFSITYSEKGKIIKSINNVKRNEKIVTAVSDGKILSKTINTERRKDAQGRTKI